MGNRSHQPRSRFLQQQVGRGLQGEIGQGGDGGGGLGSFLIQWGLLLDGGGRDRGTDIHCGLLRVASEPSKPAGWVMPRGLEEGHR